LQDCQIYGKVQTGGQDIEQEACALCQEACLCQVITSQKQKNDAEEQSHQKSGTYHVLIEDGHEARKLDILDLFGCLLSLFDIMVMPFSGNPGEQSHAHDLLMSKTEARAVGQLLRRLDGQVG